MTAQTLEEFAASIGAEIVDLEWDEPTPTLVRTKTACNIKGCPCIEYVEGAYIYPFKHCKGGCTHTENSHGKEEEPKPKKPRKVRR